MDTFDAIDAMFHVDVDDAIGAKERMDGADDADDAYVGKDCKNVVGATAATFREGAVGATVAKAYRSEIDHDAFFVTFFFIEFCIAYSHFILYCIILLKIGFRN